MNKKMNRGITLITLVVTIIILTILAGVIINLTLGKNGLLDRSKQAKEDYSNSQEKEQQELNDLYSQILIATNDSSQVTISIDDLNKLIDERIKNAGATTNPTGTVISYMGNNAPVGYLFCDGTEYNISDYPNLAEQIKTEFGSYNYYGGNGETTFAVPDLRGEFLRGTGTNGTYTTSRGSEVGIHQESQNKDHYHYMNAFNVSGSLTHWNLYLFSNNRSNSQSKTDATTSTESTVTGQTAGDEARPNNTSVLYCIKY